MTDEKLAPIFKEQAAIDAALERLMHQKQESGPGDGGGDNMEQRVTRLETQMEGVGGRLDSIDGRLDRLDNRLDRIEDKIPSKWDMAQVIFFVVGGLMAAAIFGPRLISMLPTSSP